MTRSPGSDAFSKHCIAISDLVRGIGPGYWFEAGFNAGAASPPPDWCEREELGQPVAMPCPRGTCPTLRGRIAAQRERSPQPATPCVSWHPVTVTFRCATCDNCSTHPVTLGGVPPLQSQLAGYAQHHCHHVATDEPATDSRVIGYEQAQAIASRYAAGETFASLRRDYGLDYEGVPAAIRATLAYLLDKEAKANAIQTDSFDSAESGAGNHPATAPSGSGVFGSAQSDEAVSSPLANPVIRSGDLVVGKRYRIVEIAECDTSPVHSVGDVVTCCPSESVDHIDDGQSRAAPVSWFATKTTASGGTYVTAVQLVEDEPEKPIGVLIEASSLGAPEAKAIREQAPPEAVARVLARTDELDGVIHAAEGVVLEPGEYEIVEIHVADNDPAQKVAERFVVFSHQRAASRADGPLWPISSRTGNNTWVTAVRRVEARAKQGAEAERCLTCDSPSPHLHPAIQYEGEVTVCNNPFHARVTPENASAGERAFLEWDNSGDREPNGFGRDTFMAGFGAASRLLSSRRIEPVAAPLVEPVGRGMADCGHGYASGSPACTDCNPDKGCAKHGNINCTHCLDARRLATVMAERDELRAKVEQFEQHFRLEEAELLSLRSRVSELEGKLRAERDSKTSSLDALIAEARAERDHAVELLGEQNDRVDELQDEVTDLKTEVSRAGIQRPEALDEELQKIDDAVVAAGGERDQGAVTFIANQSSRLETAEFNVRQFKAAYALEKERAESEIAQLRTDIATAEAKVETMVLAHRVAGDEQRSRAQAAADECANLGDSEIARLREELRVERYHLTLLHCAAANAWSRYLDNDDVKAFVLEVENIARRDPRLEAAPHAETRAVAAPAVVQMDPLPNSIWRWRLSNLTDDGANRTVLVVTTQKVVILQGGRNRLLAEFLAEHEWVSDSAPSEVAPVTETKEGA